MNSGKRASEATAVTEVRAVQALSARGATASIMTTLVLPPEALTIFAAPPDLVSQANVDAVVGLPGRTYLELLRRPDCSVKITRLGKLRIVHRVEFLAWLRTLPSAPPSNDPSEGSGAGLEALAEEFDLKQSPTTRSRRRK